MILIIRGHIRQSFETHKLIDFIKNMHHIFSDIQIYIHTWNIFSNNLSWRPIQINNTIVSEETIHNYFGDLKHLIKHIIIDNDSNIKLIGNLHGRINGSMPIHGWKNYWYGKYKIIDYLFNQNINANEMIVNLRFDILDNSNSFNTEFIINFIQNNIGKTFTRNSFAFNDEEHCGIDNIYIGNIHTMHTLIKKFYYDLDSILRIHNTVRNQERLAYRINTTLF